MAYFHTTAKKQVRQKPDTFGYYLSNDTASRRTVPQYVPPQQDCPSGANQWASENIAGIVAGGLGLALAGMGIGYVMGANQEDNKRKQTLENNLRGYYNAQH
jgi:hypothetical protein